MMSRLGVVIDRSISALNRRFERLLLSRIRNGAECVVRIAGGKYSGNSRKAVSSVSGIEHVGLQTARSRHHSDRQVAIASPSATPRGRFGCIL